MMVRGGACTHWKAPPLHGARRGRSFVSSLGTGKARPDGIERLLKASFYNSAPRLHQAWDCRAIGGQAAAATLGSASFAAKKRCPKLAPSVPL